MKLSDIYYDSHFGEFEELFRQSRGAAATTIH